MAQWLMSPQQVENHAYYRERVNNTEHPSEEVIAIGSSGTAVETPNIEIVTHDSIDTSIEEIAEPESSTSLKRPVPSEPSSPEKSAKRVRAELPDLPDDMNERDYVEQFLRTSVEDFLPSDKSSDKNSADLPELDSSLDPDKLKAQNQELRETLKKLQNDNKNKQINVAKRFYQVEEKLKRREAEREQNEDRLRLTLEKVTLVNSSH